MERVSSVSTIEKVPTFLEQLRQKRLEHEEKQKQQEARQQEDFEKYLQTLNITPLNPGSKELAFVLDLAKEEILQSCLSSYCEFYLNAQYDKIVKEFPDWSRDKILPQYQPAFFERSMSNLTAALKAEGLHMRQVYDRITIQWEINEK